jgi:hypothetical protein
VEDVFADELGSLSAERKDRVRDLTTKAPCGRHLAQYFSQILAGELKETVAEARCVGLTEVRPEARKQAK